MNHSPSSAQNDLSDERINELALLNLGYDRAIRPLDFARAIEREVRAAASAHTIGEDAANVASCELCKGVGQIGMPGQRCFACDGSGKSKFSALAANVAIGEREAFEAAFRSAHEFPEQADQVEFLKGWQAGIMFARAALTAEKVAGQEPYGYAPVHPTGNYFTRNKSTADYVGGLMPVYAAPQQPAQPVAQTPALTDEQIHERVLLACHSDPVSFTGQYVLTLDEIRALLTVAQPASSLAEGGERE